MGVCEGKSQAKETFSSFVNQLGLYTYLRERVFENAAATATECICCLGSLALRFPPFYLSPTTSSLVRQSSEIYHLQPRGRFSGKFAIPSSYPRRFHSIDLSSVRVSIFPVSGRGTISPGCGELVPWFCSLCIKGGGAGGYGRRRR